MLVLQLSFILWRRAVNQKSKNTKRIGSRPSDTLEVVESGDVNALTHFLLHFALQAFGANGAILGRRTGQAK
jgi:hypothetical protein